MFSANNPKIAVDFDGTIVESRYPDIGKPKMFAFETLKRLQNKGFILILWTYRYGKELDKAVEFCKQNGIEFYAVNESFPGEEYKAGEMSRKIDVDIFVDDRNVGGMLNWGEIYHKLTNAKLELEKPSKGFLSKLFKG